jgi:hypothetical protein
MTLRSSHSPAESDRTPLLRWLETRLLLVSAELVSITQYNPGVRGTDVIEQFDPVAVEIELRRWQCANEIALLRRRIRTEGGSIRDLLQFDCDILAARQTAEEQCRVYAHYISVYDPIRIT